MAKNRFGRDYRLIDTFDEKGRVRTTTEYIGASYRFENEPRIVREAVRKLLPLCAAGWIFFVAAMALPSAAMHRLYTSLPVIFTAIPLFLLTDHALTLRKMDPAQPMEHRRADLVNNRFPPAALFVVIFPALALTGELVSFLTGTVLMKGDILFAAGCGVLLFIGRFLFAQRGKLKAKEVTDGQHDNA